MINCVFQQRIKKILAVQSCSQASEKQREERMDGRMKGSEEAGHTLSCIGSLLSSRFTLFLFHAFTSLYNICHSSSSLLPLQRLKQKSVVTFPLRFSSSPPLPPSYSHRFLFPMALRPLHLPFHLFIVLSIFQQLLLFRFHPLLLLLFLLLFSLHGEHQEAGEGGVFPSSH